MYISINERAGALDLEPSPTVACVRACVRACVGGWVGV